MDVIIRVFVCVLSNCPWLPDTVVIGIYECEALSPLSLTSLIYTASPLLPRSSIVYRHFLKLLLLRLSLYTSTFRSATEAK